MGARLRGSDLRFANARGAYLVNADLRNAHLQNADLSLADLQEADLSETILQGASLRGAYLQGTDLCKVKAVTASQIKKARNWQLAFYSDDFLKELGLPADHNETLEKKLAEMKKGKEKSATKP